MTSNDPLAELRASPPPPCAALLPFEFEAADKEAGTVRLRFSPQPAFGNHFGNVQGGFAVAMLDVPLSAAAFLATGRWLPTIELKTSFIAPVPIASIVAVGRVIKAGRRVVFVEASLVAEDGAPLVTATATVLVTER